MGRHKGGERQCHAGSDAMVAPMAVRTHDTARRGLHTHLDVQFLSLKADECSGMLAEVWGLVAMSETTAALLQPPGH